MKTFSDLFRYEDDFATMDNWLEFAGPVFAQDNAIGLTPSIPQAVYLTRTQMDSLEHMVRMSFRISRASENVRAAAMLRAEFTSGGSPDLIHRCYLVTIDGLGVIRIYSILTSDPAPSPIASGMIDLDTTRAHTMIAKVVDAGRSSSLDADLGARISVYIDDEITPALTCLDQRTGRPEGLYVGFDISDNDYQESVTLGEFYAAVLRSSVIRNPQAMPELRTFGDLKYEAAFRLDRAGNSQFDATMIGHFVNDAQAEVYRANHPWPWAERITHFTTAEGVVCYELPPYVKWPGGLTDRTNGRVLLKRTWKDMNRLDPGASVNPGNPFAYTVIGTGDYGGLVIRLMWTPDGEYYVELPYYARPIPMVEDTDLPLIPPEYNEILIFGALKRGSQYSDGKTLYQTSSVDFDKMLAQMRRESIAQRDQDFLLRFKNSKENVARSLLPAVQGRRTWPLEW